MEESGRGVNYKGLAGSDVFQQYVTTTHELQSADLSSLDPNAHRSLFISTVSNSICLN